MFGYLVSVALLVAGCVAQVAKDRTDALTESRAALNAAPVCCKSLRELPYEKMPRWYDGTFDIDRTSLAYQFPYGKSFFKAFELPEIGRSFTLHLESRLSGPGLDEEGKWFLYPVVALLDENHRPLGAMRDHTLRVVDSKAREGLTILATRATDGRKARYMVIYTEPAYIARTFNFRRVLHLAPNPPAGTKSGPTKVPPGLGQVSIPYSYEGRIKLRISHDSLAPGSPQER